MNILREDWKPVLNLNAVMVGLQYLFLEPNADDPLNKGRFDTILYTFPSSQVLSTVAAEDLRRDRNQFANNVKRSLRGGSVGDETFDSVLVKA